MFFWKYFSAVLLAGPNAPAVTNITCGALFSVVKGHDLKVHEQLSVINI